MCSAFFYTAIVADDIIFPTDHHAYLSIANYLDGGKDGRKGLDIQCVIDLRSASISIFETKILANLSYSEMSNLKGVEALKISDSFTDFLEILAHGELEYRLEDYDNGS